MNLVCRCPADLLSQLIEDVLGIALEVEMIRRLGLERGGVPADADMRNGVRGAGLGWLGSRAARDRDGALEPVVVLERECWPRASTRSCSPIDCARSDHGRGSLRTSRGSAVLGVCQGHDQPDHGRRVTERACRRRIKHCVGADGRPAVRRAPDLLQPCALLVGSTTTRS